MRGPARSCGSTKHRLPEGILPCCDVINRGAALYDDLVYFGTLDAQLVALDQKTGKVAWSKKIADYQDGYTITAAPIIVKDMVITGLSGGEFGVVGKVEARDAKTGELIWTRPTIEGHMGTLHGKESTMTGERNKTWPGDTWGHGGGAPWNGGTYDPEDEPDLHRHRQPGAVELARAARRQPLHGLDTRINPENGEIVWHFQYTPHDGWDFDGASEFVPFDYQEWGHDGEGRRASQPQRVLLCARPHERQVYPGLSLREQDHRGPSASTRRGRRLKPATVRPIREAAEGQPASGASAAGSPRRPRVGLHGSVVPRRQELEADGLQPRTPAVLRALQRVGHGHLERADLLQEGGRFPRRRLHDQAALRGPHRRAAGGRPEDRQDRVGTQEQSAAVERRAGHQGRAGVRRHAGRLPQGV